MISKAKKFALVWLCLFWLPLCFANPTLKLNYAGLTGKALDNVSKTMEVKQKALGEKPTTKQMQFFLHDAKKDIQNALKPYGYFKPTVTTSTKKPKPEYP